MTDDKKLNPWKLTPRECAALASLIAVGNNKAAAKHMGVEAKTVEVLTRLARVKMSAGADALLSRVQAAVAYDRWTREQP